MPQVLRMSAREVLPSGPAFISYRQSDGTATAVALAWLLRAAGIPVWQDQTDLPPGDTRTRLAEALDCGLSGACLVVTEDIAESGVVRTIELPELLAIAEDPNFSLVIANTVRKKPDIGLDYGAPDRLLAQPDRLSSFKQYPADTREGLVQVAGEMLDARAAEVRSRREPTSPALLRISVQTRERPHAHPADGADLSIRLRPASHGRLPDPDSLVDLQDALPLLPHAVGKAAASEVRITGGAHLSVAFALGAALPSTLLPTMSVDDGKGGVWSCGPVSTTGAAELASLKSHGMRPLRAPGVRREVLIYVDLLPTPSDAAFTRLLSENDFDAHEQICPSTSGLLDPATSGPLVEEIASRLRSLVQRHDHARLHLLLRCPFPVAVLLGRLCNTLRVVVYEWDDTELTGDPDARPRYVPTLQVQATHAHGPVTDVLLKPAPTTGTTS
jgi:hypothetical protein